MRRVWLPLVGWWTFRSYSPSEAVRLGETQGKQLWGLIRYPTREIFIRAAGHPKRQEEALYHEVFHALARSGFVPWDHPDIRYRANWLARGVDVHPSDPPFIHSLTASPTLRELGHLAARGAL